VEPVIELHNITKSFEMRQEGASLWRNLGSRLRGEPVVGVTRKVVLSDISFDIHRGERVALIGRNGAGKSTLLKIISRILKADSGTFTVRGSITSLLELGVGFHPELTGSDNIFFYGALMGKDRAQVNQVYDEICAFADIGGYIDQPVKLYSSGMYQRLGFACAFAMRPDMLIADEGLSVGDFIFQKKCEERIQDIVRDGSTFLMVAHSAHQVRRIAERGIWLENGRIERDGPVIDVQDAYTKFLIVEKSRSDAKAQDAKQQHLANVAESIESKPAPGIEGPLVRILGAKSVADFAEWEPNTTYEVMVRFETLVDFVELRPRVRLTSVADEQNVVENNYMGQPALEFAAGIHQFKVTLPVLNLRGGLYRVEIDLFDESSALSLSSNRDVLIQFNRNARKPDIAQLTIGTIKVEPFDV
jgi:ABC-type polysaccharide/polyol phosphate transport system ATPase subunit